MTNKQLNKNPVRPIIKAYYHHKLDIDEGESTTSTELSEDSMFHTPTASSEDSRPIETPHVPTVSITSKHDNVQSSIIQPMTEFESPQENGEQITVKENKLLTSNFTIETQNRKVEELIMYSLD